MPTPGPAVAGNRLFALIVVGMLLAGMAVLLLLNTMLAQGAFALQTLQVQQSTLTVDQQAQAEKVLLAQSPAALQKRAVALGMEPAPAPVFLRPSDGRIFGVPIPAPQPRVAATTTATAGATTATTTSPASTTTATTKPAATATTAARTGGQSDAATTASASTSKAGTALGDADGARLDPTSGSNR
jgi:hypothetical protein